MSAYEAPILSDLLDNGRHNNTSLPSDLLGYLIAGRTTCGVTGRAGTGKGVILRALVDLVDPKLTLKVLTIDGQTDTYLAEDYPQRNMISVSADTVLEHSQTQNLRDAFVHRDFVTTVVPCVCTDSLTYAMVYLNAILSGGNALFTHHAQTTSDLVYCLRNAVCNVARMDSIHLAEELILSFVKFDVHMNYTCSGVRYIERITEIVPIESTTESEKGTGPVAEYLRILTPPKRFDTRDIVVFDEATQTYVAASPITPALVERMSLEMSKVKAQEFKQFMQTNFE